MVEKIIPQGTDNINSQPPEFAPKESAGRRALPRPLRRAGVVVRSAAEVIRTATGRVMTNLRRKLERVSAAASERTSHEALPRSAGIMVLCAAVAIVIASAFVGVGLEVFVDGEPVGYVRDREEFSEVIESVEAKASTILGYPYIIKTDVSYQLDIFARQGGSKELDAAEVERALFSDIEEITQMYVLTVDGVVIGANQDGDALRAMTDGLIRRAERSESDDASVELLEDVAVTLQYTAAANEKSLEEIGEIIHSNSVEEMSYTVQEGDLLSDIAARHGMSEETLLELNPGVDASSIAAGDVLSVGEAIPLMSIKVTKTEQVTEAIEHDVQYNYSSAYWDGDSFVTTRGADGSKLITYDVVYINGKESERVVTSEEITSEPVTEVITLGTRNFILPFPGYKQITSTFGWRTYKGRADNHTGIDFAGAAGSKVRASYSGKVIYSGWKGNYGNCVIIDHGSGYKTLYAHNSRLAVKVGDYVEQGDTISYVGSTGKSSGPHCHFEIIINGTPVNPYRYLF